ncbi:thiamine phosphate synthase [Phaeovibrio sulfidiphilus]|uniref:Thiamine-phosphate synthase n=1 Tax=Phaeovibrio sulfidiphilus TaxID=1220600 RepID=A0A8J6YYB4_9PROT|nr:thiamine phosphate synthase [Phaeovibrio sulfidiphilus]MBE1237902.1 thiamine phosphate synthase [Phaeovibrio sulfidiphilus]
MARTRLYLISPSQIDDPDAFAARLDSVFRAGDVASFQLRLKGVEDAAILRAVEAVRPVCHAADVALVLNDRADLAARSGCDGVHLGQEDGSCREARRLLGDDAIIGVTCHDSRHLGMEAAEAGADYVAFGAFYPTGTKEVRHVAGLDVLRWWGSMMVVPCVAIGGITPDNAAPLVEAGADFLAVSAGVWEHPEGPEAAVRAFDALFDRLEAAAEALSPEE